VGLVCRVVEAAGISTVCVSTGRDLTEQVMPPRSVFVNFPMGNAFGKPFDRSMQLAVLRAALEWAATATEAGRLVALPYVWPEPFGFNPGPSNM
jgi:D-proline reductase (dithiol) PrdB